MWSSGNEELKAQFEGMKDHNRLLRNQLQVRKEGCVLCGGCAHGIWVWSWNMGVVVGVVMECVQF